MNKALKLSAVVFAAIVASGCSNHTKQNEARLQADNEAAVRAEDRANQAYQRAEEATAAAILATEKSQETLEEVNAVISRIANQAEKSNQTW